ncbi:MAG: RluA family pseudouridine synthase, partial [Prevotella sp.]|nr:RluA family pseudouridine synthase [Prevotella sp.]
MKLFHPLHTNIEKPNEMNNPFDYEPHPLCMLAVEKLLPLIPQNDEGKMFGVLVVENQEGELGYLAAYSGQINGMDDEEIFVPAIFDYLQPDGYFKTHEAEITNINHSIHALEHDERFLNAEKKLNELKEKREKAVDEYKLLMQKSKALRDERRKKGNVSKEEDEAMIKESQFQKAELRRIKSMFSQPIDTLYGHYTLYLQEVEELKHLRKQLSDALQSWLFSQFNILNLHGESK